MAPAHDEGSGALAVPTPLVRASSLGTGGRTVYLKNETVLPTGTFKVRGALHALEARLARGPIREVIAASTGNHGAAVAWAARSADVACTVFVPRHPNPVKAARIGALGAQLIERGADLSAAIESAYEYAEKGGGFFLHDAADPDVPAGTAQIGAEILVQQPAVDRIYVPMGDTALIRGVASSAKKGKPSVRIIGVVAANAPAYLLSWRDGSVVETPGADTIADGLAVRSPLAPNVTAIRGLVDEVHSVTEQDMLEAIRHLYVEEGIVAEPAGAAATAAFMKDGSLSPVNVLLVTGRNIAHDVATRAGIPDESLTI